MSDPRVIAWELQDASYNPPLQKHADAQSLTSSTAPSTSQLDETRALDVQPGGRYRALTKLYINFSWAADSPSSPSSETPWRIATGFLITPSIIATAAHNIVSFSSSPLAPAAQIKAYIGYRGSASVAERYTQFRSGKKALVPESWVTTRGARQDSQACKGTAGHMANIAFIQLDRPFEGVTAVRTAHAPGADAGAGEVEVAGYAADREDPGTREYGGVVWRAQRMVDLGPTRAGLLSYVSIDSFGGLVGAPLIRTSDNYAIGIHAFGGDPNLAIPFGPGGVDVDAYVNALEGEFDFGVGRVYSFPLGAPEKRRSVEVGEVERAFPVATKSAWEAEGTRTAVLWVGYVIAGVVLARWLDRR